ncbi:MAG TPA: type II toxin-antitoxin system HicA family toxin [Candidatus Nanoarchaeia archaeon]|nr:type II toxin-antitoxin system HicA family toxin [Candidatus Nanoarchaeia archaeon]
MKLPVVSSDEVIKVLQKGGFSMVRQKGSHMSFHKLEQGKTLLVVVPRRREIKKGTLLSIIKQAGMTREDFIRSIQ